MGSDRARVTYDPTRQYRAVVAQQGRVMVEADQNEAWTIEGERERRTLLDLVGGAGTPDDGYWVASAGQGADLTAGAGTMYVGGVRVELDAPVTYSQQSEWLDHDGDPDWVEPAVPGSSLVLLELTEREVSATEDAALREVALGGPDTAQRLRLLQRIKRIGTAARTCDGAMAEAASHWQVGGRDFSPTTMVLGSSALLQVGLPAQGPPPDACDPAPIDGYLGAENQLIRVQVTDTGSLLWGFDDASFLYRVDVVNSQLVTLRSRPPDAFHQPRAGQAVELLRSAAWLTDTDLIASATGHVLTLTGAYDPESQQVPLPLPLDSVLTDAAKTPQVFLRVWEEELTFAPGTPVTLGTTGLEVTLTSQGGAPFHPGDFWLFAVRPSTPAVVYPDRYLTSPQPPDGPRTWVCPLAVIQVGDGRLDVVEDCRCRLDNLGGLTSREAGCCDVVVRPEHAQTLQAVIDDTRVPATICLMPGVYELPAPLRIGPGNANLTIEGHNEGVVLRAAPGREPQFLQGLVVLEGVTGVTLRSLELDLPLVSLESAGAQAGGLRSNMVAGVLGPLLRDLIVSIGIRPVECTRLTVEACSFQFRVPAERDVFAAGIFAGGSTSGLRLHRSRFARVGSDNRVAGRPYRVLAGCLLASSVEVTNTAGAPAAVPATLDDASVRDNSFDGLGAAVLALATLGTIRIEDNTVVRSNAGFLLIWPGWLDFIGLQTTIRVQARSADAATTMQDLLLAILLDPMVQIAGTIARAFPLPEGSTAKAVPFDQRQADAEAANVVEGVQALFDRTLASLPAAVAAAASTDSVALQDRIAVVAPPFASTGALGPFTLLGESLTAMERPSLMIIEPGPNLSLDASGNDVQAFITQGTSSTAFAVLDGFSDPGQATITGNRWRNSSVGAPTVALALVQFCAVNGNVVRNDTQKPTSLVVLPAADGGASTAIAGNTFFGPPLLPPRSLAPPLNTWNVLNAEVV
jgi:hypothetical protein